MSITFGEANDVTLYYGNYFLSFANSASLSTGNIINFEDETVSFFVIQSAGTSTLTSLDIEYSCSTVYEEKFIPEIRIDTELMNLVNPSLLHLKKLMLMQQLTLRMLIIVRII